MATVVVLYMNLTLAKRMFTDAQFSGVSENHLIFSILPKRLAALLYCLTSVQVGRDEAFPRPSSGLQLTLLEPKPSLTDRLMWLGSLQKESQRPRVWSGANRLKRATSVMSVSSDPASPSCVAFLPPVGGTGPCGIRIL